MIRRFPSILALSPPPKAAEHAKVRNFGTPQRPAVPAMKLCVGCGYTRHCSGRCPRCGSVGIEVVAARVGGLPAVLA
jgi:hypothetical protein